MQKIFCFCWIGIWEDELVKLNPWYCYCEMCFDLYFGVM